MLNKIQTLVILISFLIPSFLNAQESSDTTGNYAKYMSEIDTTSLGSNLSLEAVAEIFRTSKDLEEFEKRLNDKEEGVNNLDLNGDGETDYLRVVDHAEGNTHVIVIQAVVGKDLFQDIASIDVVQDGDKVTLQLVGDEAIYGIEYYLEPETQEEVKDYPAVKVIFVVGYSPYYSPYYWGYYPPYYSPWPPYPPYYYHRRYYHRHYYHRPYNPHRYNHAPHARHSHARNVYNQNHRSAPINKTNRPTSSPSQKPSTRPNQPSTKPAQKPSQNPSTRPSQNPAQKPSQNPSTRPSQNPSAKPSQSPSTRPSQNPSAKPAQKPSKAPSTQPSQRPQSTQQARPSQPSRSSQPSARPQSRPQGRSGGRR